MKNNGNAIKKAKEIKSGHSIQRLFKVFRSGSELAKACSFRGCSFQERKLHIILREYNTDKYPQYGYKFTVDGGRYVSADGYKSIDSGRFQTFKEANEFFIEQVKKYNLDNDFYSTKRYEDHINGDVEEYDYLTFLLEESKNM